MGLDMYVYKINKKMDKDTFYEICPLLDTSIESAEKILFNYESMDEESFFNEYFKFHSEAYVKKVGYEKFKKELKEKSEDLCSLCKKVLNNKEILKDIEYKEIAYWRKHWGLNDLFIDMHESRGGDGDCNYLFLDEGDIEYIIDMHDIHIRDDDNWKNSLKAFKKILNKTDWKNETVFYCCWY